MIALDQELNPVLQKIIQLTKLNDSPTIDIQILNEFSLSQKASISFHYLSLYICHFVCWFACLKIFKANGLKNYKSKRSENSYIETSNIGDGYKLSHFYLWYL